MLRELEHLSSEENKSRAWESFRAYDDIENSSFTLQEPILLQRAILASNFEKRLEYLDQCAANGKFQLAFNCLQKLRLTSNSTKAMNLNLQHREAQLLWNSNEKSAALVVIQDLCQQLQHHENANHKE